MKSASAPGPRAELIEICLERRECLTGACKCGRRGKFELHGALAKGWIVDQKKMLASALRWAALLSVVLSQNFTPAIANEFCDVEVPVITPGTHSAVAEMTAPSDAIVLFDGKDLSQWKGTNGSANWNVHEGVLTVVKGAGDIETKRLFADMQLHVEWSVPADIAGKGQLRGNSGVFMQGRYELQVLDSYQNSTYADGQAGAIYKQTAPLGNAMRKPGDWNIYDVIYTAPRFRDDGTVFSPAQITVLQNGVLIQNNTEIRGGTLSLGPPTYTAHGKGPIRLQDHPDPSAPISYRNIWVRELGAAKSPINPPTKSGNVSNHAASSVLNVDTPLGQLIDNPAARAILSQCIPALVPSPEDTDVMRKITLHRLQPLFGLDDPKLRIINEDLAKLGNPANSHGIAAAFTVDTPLGELMDSPAAWAVVSRRVPALVPDPQVSVLMRKMSLRSLQPLVGGLDDAKLHSIDDALSGLTASSAR